MTVELNRLLHDPCDRAGYDLRIDYSREPGFPLWEGDAAWAGSPDPRSASDYQTG